MAADLPELPAKRSNGPDLPSRDETNLQDPNSPEEEGPLEINIKPIDAFEADLLDTLFLSQINCPKSLKLHFVK